MMENMQERAVKATGTYLTRRGYEVLATDWKSESGGSIDVVAKDEDGTIVFVDVVARDGVEKGLPAEDANSSRERMEINAAKWLAAHAEDEDINNVAVRFDIVSMLVLAEDRALLRHHINALGANFTDSTD